MPRYNVLVTRDTTESTVVDVVADSPEQARVEALQEARDAPYNFEWVADDGVGGEPYLGDADGCCEEVPDV